MGRTYDDSPIVKTVKRLLDAQQALFKQQVADSQLYVSGATEQLMYQQGAAMTVQAGILEWLDKNFGKPGFTPSDQIAAIVEQNIAKGKAERAAAEARKAELDAAEAKLAETLEAFPSPPPNIAPAPPANAASPDAAGST